MQSRECQLAQWQTLIETIQNHDIVRPFACSQYVQQHINMLDNGIHNCVCCFEIHALPDMFSVKCF